MKLSSFALMAAGTFLVAGCETKRTTAPVAAKGAPPLGKTGPGVERRTVEFEHEAGYNDQRIAMIKRGETTEAQLLEWFGAPESREVKPDGRSQLSWSFSGERQHSGVLNVSLEPDGKVEAYSAHGQEMSPIGRGFTYDDQRVARIKRGQTTETQLVEWFGPPEARNVKPDGRQQLSWIFARTTDGKSARGAALQVGLAPDGNVDAYSARR